MTDPGSTPPQGTPVLRGDGTATATGDPGPCPTTAGKDLLATLGPIDEEFPDFDAGLEPLRDDVRSDDQDRGVEPAGR